MKKLEELLMRYLQQTCVDLDLANDVGYVSVDSVYIILALYLNKKKKLRNRYRILYQRKKSLNINLCIASEQWLNSSTGTGKSCSIRHTPYSPGLSPCDFYLLPQVEKNRRDLRFHTPADITEACDASVKTLKDVEAGIYDPLHR